MKRRVRRLLLSVGVWGCAIFACSRARPDDEAAPAQAAPPPWTSAEALTQVLTARHALGPHRMRGTASQVVTDTDQPAIALEEQALVEEAADGTVHALYTNSRGEGRELYAADGLLWLRPRYGKFHRRPPADADEAARTAAEIAGTFAAEFDLVAASADVHDAGTVTIAGRAAHRITLTRGQPRTHAPQRGPRAWRDQATIETVEGELALDDASGALLSGRLRAQVRFERDGHSLQLTLESTHEVTDLGAAIAVAVPSPDESVATPTRSTDLDDRDELLGGLAAPTRRGNR